MICARYLHFDNIHEIYSFANDNDDYFHYNHNSLTSHPAPFCPLQTMEYLRTSILLSLLLPALRAADCARERCCQIDTCTTLYCQQKNSETWISTENFQDYQFTKLVMADNQCKPCPNNCKSCSAPHTCSACYSNYFFADGHCALCDYNCKTCTQVNSLKKCSECDSGTYLDTTTLTCKSCPVGAESCSSSSSIISCQPGYQKSSNSLFCTPCPENCLYCPISTSYCSTCASGYYTSAGTCRACTPANCQTCIGVGLNVFCTKCNSGYLVSSGQCRSCPARCLTCTSTTTCSKCEADYYIIGGGCSSVSSQVPNCQTYSSASACSACSTGYYLTDNQCYPCSILCDSCYGPHFGTCTLCSSTSKLFNQMCIANPFPSASQYRMFLALPAEEAHFSGGSLECDSLLYSGTSLSVWLRNLSGFKISLVYKIYTSSPGQQYTISLNNDTVTLSSSSEGYAICNSTLLYVHRESSTSFADIKLENELMFSSQSNMHISEILLTVFKCNDLCIECSENQCFTCINDKLFTQDAYCVYICSTGYYTYEQDKQCVSECPLRTYPLLTNASCISCSPPCYTCLSHTYCLSCQDGLFLTHDYTCQQYCPYRYYGSDTTQRCEKCVGRCNECVSDEDCLSCAVGFLQNTTCVDDCASGLYEDLSTLTCEDCSSECSECEYSPSYCLSCIQGLVFFNNTCLSACPDAYYSDGINCLPCAYPCENCQNTSTTCLTCVDSYLLNSDCVSPCPDSYYEDNVLLICSPCSPSCSLCYSSSDNCLQCVAGYYWIDHSCVQSCPEGYYEDSYNSGLGICSPCGNLCKDCTTQTFCLACMSNFLNEEGECVRASLCPQAMYAEIDSLECKTCNSSCLTCEISPDSCTSCPDNLILHQNTCLDSCPSHYYFNSSFTCLLCIEPCRTCLDETQCLSCIQGYKYSNHVCSSTCSISTYFNTSINDCSDCTANCLACENSDFCYFCADSYFLHVLSLSENQCVSQCPDGYYPDGLSCLTCLYPCSTCTSTIDCLTCQYGLQYQSRCLLSCPDSTYRANDTCLDCGGNCLTCKENANVCVSCKSGFLLYSLECIVSCPVGSYPFLVTQECLACPTTCSECTNSTYCTQCIVNQTYLSTDVHSCVEFCASGFYGNSGSGQCQRCEQKCLTCLTSAENCLACASNYVLVKLEGADFDCLGSCPDGYYEDNGVCYKCMFPCQQCSSAVACLTCATGTYYHANSSSCLLTCPMGTFYSTQSTPTCEECVSPCSTCLNATNCISCEGSLLLYGGTCVQSCPELYYADASGICNRCYGLCKTCTNKYYCLTCHTGFAYDGFCYSACPPGTYASASTRKCEACIDPCLECTNSPHYCKRCQFNMFAYQGDCSETCPKGTYQSGEVCLTCQFPCTDCPDQFSCNECIGGYLLYMKDSCIPNVQKCPNDLYKMDSKECVPFTWCPSTYFKDEILKTCSESCNRPKYVHLETSTCSDSCNSGQYVGKDMICTSWQTPPTSLMGMEIIAFIQSSEMHIVVTFNESAEWDENGDELFVLTNKDLSARRVLASTNLLNYKEKEGDEAEKDLVLRIAEMPHRVNVNLPAHYVHSSMSLYPLQTPEKEVLLPGFTAYTYEQVHTGSVLGQFSEGVSWFIIIFSLFFLFMNRLSDVYILWDTAQLLYLLVFLHIQYPPNLNEFLKGMSNTHFLFIPSLFSALSPSYRLVSDLPFYAYSYDCSFLRTAGSPILLILIVVIFFLLLKLLELLNSKWQAMKEKLDKYPKVKQFVFKGILRFRWHHASDTFFLSYDIILLFALAELSKSSQNPGQVGSNVVAGLFLIAFLFFPFFVGYKLSKHYENIARGKMVTNLQCFYRGIEKSNKFGVYLILLRYFRKIAYCAIIAIFSMEPMFALPILMFTSVLMGLFLFINKPFKKRLSNVITIATEAILVIVFVLIALINFNAHAYSEGIKLALGWVCCLLLSLMIFALVFEVFCKTMFYLEPQKKESGESLLDKNKFSEEYLRAKAGEFFEKIFPRIKKELKFDDSEDEMMEYEEGDSENSENNEMREKKWGLDSQDSSRKSDEFRHYNEDSDTNTEVEKGKKPPNYLIRCVKELN